ncbi:alpha/beta fold hydrolase [Aurantivibrio plasticivorans]
MNDVQPLTITSKDGFPIAINYFAPINAKAQIVIAPAMGVPQRFYRYFSTWLQKHNYAVTTFDYRGIGESSPGTLKNFSATLNDWAEKDAAAVLASVLDKGQPVIWIGHSFGGQSIGMIPRSEEITHAITIASGSGYWRDVNPTQSIPSLVLWYGMVPVLSYLFGYFPGRKIGLIGDIPKQAMWQWRRWCLNPTYLFGAEPEATRDSYKRLTFPLTSFSFADDEMMTKRGVDLVHSFYSNAQLTRHHYQASEFGLKRIGHLDFFKEGRERLWESMVFLP